MSNFIEVPKIVFKTDISSSAKVLYCHLIWYSEEIKSGEIEMTNKQLASDMRSSTVTISRLIKELKENNLITAFDKKEEDDYGYVIAWKRVLKINMEVLNYYEK